MSRHKEVIYMRIIYHSPLVVLHELNIQIKKLKSVVNLNKLTQH